MDRFRVRIVPVVILSLFFGLIFNFSYAKIREDAQSPILNQYGLSKAATELPPSAIFSWIGAGYLTVYTISNTGQSGLFEPPPGWGGYDGIPWPAGFGMGNGRTGEFPRGTEQFYVWGAGLWIGAKSPHFNTADDKSVTVNLNGVQRNFSNVRVAATAYYSDQSAISRLWQSNQLINGQLDGKNPTYAGQYLFGQKNKNIEEYQDVWSFLAPNPGDYYGLTAEDTVYRLDYEEINEKRLAVLESNPSLDPDIILLDPFRLDQKGNVVGDIVSDEDTYTVFGDYVRERYGSFLWTRGYDVRSLGVEVVQRTYSWSIDDYIYINYKIKNVNDFPLDSVFIGYFMDNDIGFADDDLIGFDKKLNLGYSYDYDLMETGWQTSAGYLGSVFAETPKDTIDGELKQIGLTGFQTWIRSDLGVSEGFAGDVDDDGVDHLKYVELAMTDSFEVFEKPQDVRQLATSGPVKRMNPGDEISVTVVLVAGASLSELKTNTEAAIDKYNAGFIGPEPPSSPMLTVIPGHHSAYLSWTNDPVDDIDPYTGEQDFEGFRVYKSSSGLQDDWELLADYDVDEDSTINTATTEYTKGSSNATAEYVGVISDEELQGFQSGNQDEEELQELLYERFKDAEYTIEFLESDYVPSDVDDENPRKMVIYDVTNRQLVPLNKGLAQQYGYGFCIYGRYDGVRPDESTRKFDDVYRSGAYIYFNGMYIRLSDGYYIDTDQDGLGNGVRDEGEPFQDVGVDGLPNTSDYGEGNEEYDLGEPFVDIEDDEKEQQSLTPAIGDIFTIRSYVSKDIGNQTDLSYTYTDAGLTDGMTYYYAVTAYDKGYPALNIPSLESSFYQNITAVVPQHQSLAVTGEPGLLPVDHEGESTGRVLRGILDHRDLRGHEYEFKFFKNDPNSNKMQADYGILIDNDLPSESIYNENVGGGDSTATFEGRVIQMDIIPGTVVIEIQNEIGIITDDSLGALLGVIDGDTVRGVIHYGRGKITLTHDSGVFQPSDDIIVDYDYTTLRLMHWGPDTLASTIVKNTQIYAVKELMSDSTTQDHGFLFLVDSPKLSVDSVAWGLGTNVSDIFRAELSESKVEPYDYIVTFPDTGAPTAITNHPFFPKPNQRVPWKITNTSMGVISRNYRPKGAFIMDEQIPWVVDAVKPYDSLSINTARVFTEDVRESAGLGKWAFDLTFIPIDTNLATADYLDHPTEDDTLFIFTARPITPEDVFTFKTVNMYTPVEKIDLGDIKVVPNPYYIRARWDTDRYTQHIDFRHLPAPPGTESVSVKNVHIRIFNVAGNLIAHLKKNNIVEDNEVRDEYGTLSWDLRNYEGLKIASGLYIYQVKAEIDGKKEIHTGKIAIILGP